MAKAPVMPPVVAPVVQVKLLKTLAVKTILGSVPLQILTVDPLVSTGVGFTVIPIAGETSVTLIHEVTVLLYQILVVNELGV